MKTLRILFIGNSFTHRNDMPATICRLAAATRPPRLIEAERVIANGMSLKTHWTRGIAAERIRQSAWDYVVLQEQSTLPLKNRAKMHEYVRLFDGLIRAAGARTVLYLTWARQKETERQAELTDAYVSIGHEVGALIAPVGVAWQKILALTPSIALYDRDGSHPSPVGSYLAASVFVATILRKIPTAPPEDLPALSSLKPAEIQTLHEIALNTALASNPRD